MGIDHFIENIVVESIVHFVENIVVESIVHFVENRISVKLSLARFNKHVEKTFDEVIFFFQMP